MTGGFTTHHFLPVTQFVHESPVQIIKDRHIYTHFLSGDAILSAFLLKWMGMGQGGLPILRMILATLGFLSLLTLVLQARKYIFSPTFPYAVPFLLAGLFFVPNFYLWNLTFTGVSYSNFCILATLALGMSAQGKKTLTWPMRIGFFVLGFLCIYFYMAMIFVACLSPLIGGLMVPASTRWRRLLECCFWVGVGITGGYLLHFWQVAAEVQSWSLAWEDQIGTFINRSGDESPSGPSRIQLIGQYSDHTRAFFRINSLHLAFSGLFLAWLLPNKNRHSLVAAVLVSLTASYIWILLLKRSSTIHTFLFPQLFLTLYWVWLVLVARVMEWKILLKTKA